MPGCLIKEYKEAESGDRGCQCGHFKCYHDTAGSMKYQHFRVDYQKILGAIQALQTSMREMTAPRPRERVPETISVPSSMRAIPPLGGRSRSSSWSNFKLQEDKEFSMVEKEYMPRRQRVKQPKMKWKHDRTD